MPRLNALMSWIAAYAWKTNWHPVGESNPSFQVENLAS